MGKRLIGNHQQGCVDVHEKIAKVTWWYREVAFWITEESRIAAGDNRGTAEDLRKVAVDNRGIAEDLRIIVIDYQWTAEDSWKIAVEHWWTAEDSISIDW